MATKAMEEAKRKAEEAALTLGTNEPVDKSESSLLEEVLAVAPRDGMSGGDLIVLNKKRTELLAKSGYTFLDVRELTPNVNNIYAKSITDDDVENLAAQILESGHTTPIVVRQVEGKLEIVDGERRYRARKLLGEKHGEQWYMIPARLFSEGELSDEDTLFLLHAANMGQRVMTPSERADGFKAVYQRLLKRRKEDPSLFKGKKTREILAEQMGVSKTTALRELTIGQGLGEKGRAAYDEGLITQFIAEALAKLGHDEQDAIIDMIRSGEVQKEEVMDVIKKKDTTPRLPKPADNDLITARRALKRALKKKEPVNNVMLAEIKELVQKIESFQQQ